MPFENMVLLISSAAAFFLAGNVYFLKRLVDKIDTCERNSNAQIVEAAETRVKLDALKTEFNTKIDSLKNDFIKFGDKLRNINNNINELKKIEKEVAILQTIVNYPGKFGV